MKKFLLFLSLCMATYIVNAQNEMWIYKSDGSIMKYNTAEIDSVKFVPANEQEPDDQPNGNAISNLTSDYEIDLSNCTGYISCYGDYWDCGYCNWSIEFICNDGIKEGVYLVLDFLTDDNMEGASGIVGTYRSSGFTEYDSTKPNFAPYTFIPGIRISDDGSLMIGSLLQEHKDGVGVNQASIYGGEFTIETYNDGTVSIVIDATDDADPSHKITLNWRGELK